MLKLISTIILSAVLLLGTQARAEEEFVLTEEQQVEMTRFVIGNTVWTMYHETGHALISLFDIPILGKEEDAADNLANIIMLSQEDELTDDYLKKTALGWFLFDEFAAEAGDELDFTDEHSFDLQRAYHTLCFLYGANAEKFAEFTEMMQMPEEALANCEYEYVRGHNSWLTVLEPYNLEDGAENLEVKVSYGDTTEDLETFKEALEYNEILESIRDFVTLSYKLPKSFTIEAQTCDTPNAFWDAEESKIILCYELLAEFQKLYMYELIQLAKADLELSN